MLACLVFATGFMLRGNDGFLERMGLGTYAVATEQNPGSTISGNTFDSLAARVAEVQGELEQKSLDSYELDSATKALVEDLLKQTGDPYARYFDEQSYAAYRDAGGDDLFGVGVLFGDYQNQAYAVDVIPGSPAQAAGVKEGDFVVAVDGERKGSGWTMPEVLSAVEREEGATVVITWRRPASRESSGGEEFTTTLSCGKVSQENVTWEMRDDAVGYVKVRQLGRTTSGTVSEGVKALLAQGATSFVLDLRDCPGGYLSQAVDVASLFKEKGTVVQIQTKEESPTIRSVSGRVLTDAPLAILVNGNTAAAAEVLAASLQDESRAVIVGENTMGKGTVQIMKELSFGGAISYTVAEYMSPQGRSLDGSGVSPTVRVVNDSESDQDIQLNLAIESVAAAGISG